jgi:ComF family protein
LIQKYDGPACRICGIPTISEQTIICESCVKGQPFSKILYYGLYEGTLRKAIHLLKFNGIKRLSKPLCTLLMKLPLPESDIIIPVPLHLKRLRQREFNQTALIGRRLSTELGIPMIMNCLTKAKETAAQTSLKRDERLKNVKKTFAVLKNLDGKNVLLIDDVITTGATVKECSDVLIKAGAKKVVVLALAHSTPFELQKSGSPPMID